MNTEKKKWYKKWWVWVIIGVVLIIGFASQGGTEKSIPQLNVDDYIGREAPFVYFELKEAGYDVTVSFERPQDKNTFGDADEFFESERTKYGIQTEENPDPTFIVGNMWLYENNKITIRADYNPIRNSNNDENLLPTIKSSDYVSKESLLVYHELKDKGYTLELDYARKDIQALYDNTMKMFETYKDLDPNNEDDRLSVDAYVIDSIVQNGNNIKLIIK